ncbi:MAG: hypothetical protein PWQ38_1022 [Proteiniphilum sp.]|nr:hypothetical protein [Proteiniphilum sp.]
MVIFYFANISAGIFEVCRKYYYLCTRKYNLYSFYKNY